MSWKVELLPYAQNLPEGSEIALVGAASALPESDDLVLRTRTTRAYIGTLAMVFGFLTGLAAAIALVLFLDGAFGIDFFTVRKGPVFMGFMCLFIAAGSANGAKWLVERLTARRVETRVSWTDVRINRDGAIALLLWDGGRMAAVAQLTPPVAAEMRQAQSEALGR